jgi:hypothetical protein
VTGFIVAMGRDFYDAVAGDPEMAVPGAECEEMCYFFAHLYRERFGQFPDTFAVPGWLGATRNAWR